MICDPGDYILVEEACYPGMASAVNQEIKIPPTSNAIDLRKVVLRTNNRLWYLQPISKTEITRLMISTHNASVYFFFFLFSQSHSKVQFNIPVLNPSTSLARKTILKTQPTGEDI